MRETLSVSGWVLFGVAFTVAAYLFAAIRRANRADSDGSGTLISTLMQSHFSPTSLQDITISERQFPFRVRADLQRAIDRLFDSGTTISHFCGVRKEYSHEALTLSDCIVVSQHSPAVSVPPQFE